MPTGSQDTLVAETGRFRRATGLARTRGYMMSTFVSGEFFVKPEKSEEFLGILKGALPDTRGFEGCELVETHVDQDDIGHIFLLERWGDRSDHAAYLKWRGETGMMEALAPYVTAPPKFTYFDARPEV